jgi:hypothetical protein
MIEDRHKGEVPWLDARRTGLVPEKRSMPGHNHSFSMKTQIHVNCKGPLQETKPWEVLADVKYPKPDPLAADRGDRALRQVTAGGCEPSAGGGSGV